ncbi:MarR family winged helix-turn-helix transcriptional regulator [Gordonia sp. SL306]|uniref:MarR family winged helix-turn-helix transcriptional regulator n=1 Tax=Gordonia sp. SL306 TaxID=2995145 RepID=UPI00226FEB43|nr:MarR family winged helix-turn-helix transcriptional regulator [Gordonia sp. SL306]WAC55835.1 MarR family winged helix-turn-helix transcriptional regulator [Gordonia sp. SL306]
MSKSVKPPHAAQLLGAALGELRASFPSDDWEGLRPSHFRILEAIEGGAVRTVDLAAELGMTKQGAGQHVAYLTDGGFVTQQPDPGDRRARRVELTERGVETLGRLHRRLAAIERAWIRQVGREDYATFRRVLTSIVDS